MAWPPSRPRVFWLRTGYGTGLDVRLTVRSLYAQVWRVGFTWTYNPNRVED